MLRKEQKPVPVGLWATATVILNVVVIQLGYTHHPAWYGILLPGVPLMWWALVEAARERKSGKD